MKNQMQTREYRTIDKTAWGDGPWQDEPDKKQWRDEATGLPCLAVRGPGGHWCGYVGVGPSHPWHGKSYSACVSPERHEPHEGDAEGWHYNCTPGGILIAHGGITFAGGCADQSEDRWRQMQGKVAEAQQEAQRYPRGDAAQWLAEWGPVLGDYQAWRERMQATAVCHVAGDGEPDNVWWFGFDCAHSGDLSPKYAREGSSGIYRPLSYVEAECHDLAGQLSRVAQEGEDAG